jgi:hypothetical protein
MEAMKRIQKEIDDKDEMVIQGDGEMSLIEKLHMYQTNLKAYVESRVKIPAKKDVVQANHKN